MIISVLLFKIELYYFSIVISNFINFKINEGYHFRSKKVYFNYL